MNKTMISMAAVAFLFAGTMTSCGEKSQHPGYEKTQTGLYYKFHEQTNGEQPKMGDLLEVSIRCSVNDTTDIIPTMKNMMKLTEPMFSGDVFEGLAMMHKGDSASFIVNIDSTFIKMYRQPSLPSEFKPTDVMRFDFRLNDIVSESEYLQRIASDVQARNQEHVAFLKESFAKETENANVLLQNFLKKNNVVSEPCESGLYYVVTEPGNGEKPEIGKKVKVHYTGKLLDGKVFDSSVERGQPIEFPLGLGQVIPGWDEGVAMMSKGEKGILYIPYYLAYGDRDMGDIPPFSNLVFEVELVDFE